MSARDLIFSRIRRSLGVSGTDPARKAAVTERLRVAPRGVIPGRGQVPREERLGLFARMVTATHATAEVLPARQIPEAVAAILREHSLSGSVSMGTDPRLTSLPWLDSDIDVLVGPARPDAAVGISHAEAGVAETGSLVVVASEANPSLHAFLPPVHIIVVQEADIVPDFESAFDLLDSRFGSKQPRRSVNFITGPSRSGDIELTMQLGAHGPGAVHILVTASE